MIVGTLPVLLITLFALLNLHAVLPAERYEAMAFNVGVRAVEAAFFFLPATGAALIVWACSRSRRRQSVESAAEAENRRSERLLMHWLTGRMTRCTAAVLGLFIGYAVVYLVLCKPQYGGTIDGVSIDLETGRVEFYARHLFRPQYGYAGRWDCLSGLFQPLNVIDRRLFPERWEQLQK